MKDVLDYIAKAIVDEPDEVDVTERKGDRGIVLELRVAQEDMGKVIGKGGRTVRAIRNVVKAAAIREDVHVSVDVVD
jgi:hypothetical protein